MSTGPKNPTVAVEYMITAHTWDEDMTAKYITASLVTVLRILGTFTFTPGCTDLTSPTCTTTDTKTKTSKGTNEWFNSRDARIRKSDVIYSPKMRERDIRAIPEACPTSTTQR